MVNASLPPAGVAGQSAATTSCSWTSDCHHSEPDGRGTVCLEKWGCVATMGSLIKRAIANWRWHQESVRPGEVRDLGERGAKLDRDLAMRLEFDVAPVGVFNFGRRPIVGDIDLDWQAGDARDIRVGQRLPPDLEQIAQCENARRRWRDMNLSRRIVRVYRVKAMRRGLGGSAEISRNLLRLVVHENGEVRVKHERLRGIDDAVEASDRCPIGLRTRPVIGSD